MFMKPIKKLFARQLRRDETEPEKIMWELLRNRRFLGFKFRRQHVVEGFVADFCCHQLKFIVEIDGWVHDKRKRYDNVRDEILRSKGYSIIRFKNEEVVGNLSRVCQSLEYALTLTLSRGERESKPKALSKR
jgi:very-short-patch-repair endonuclease